jgi:MFS transporter, MHS family, proline/betaine transporter
MTLVAAQLASEDIPEGFVQEGSVEKKQLLRRVIVSCMIGNALEWYDFALYGYFATLIAQQFFPLTDLFASLMATYAVYAVGFVMRPLGAIVFGHIGDKKGRKEALLWSIYLMSIPTALIGLLPTYAQIGWLAPVLLTVVRLLQGISIGGEFTSSIVFIVEHAEDGKRGFAGSWAPFSLVVGTLIGCVVAAFMTASLSQEALLEWGWRVPFLFSLLGGAVGTYMRRTLADPERFEKVKKERFGKSTPFKDLFRYHRKSLALVVLIELAAAVGFYLIVTFVVSSLEVTHNMSKSDALMISTCTMIVFACIIPFSGWLTDRIGRKPVMSTAAWAFLLLSYPLFQGLGAEGFWIPCVSHVALGIILGFYFAPLAAVIAELFPTSVRSSGLSLGHNLSMSIFGGNAIMIAFWLIKSTGDPASPAFYLMGAAILSLLGLYLMRDRFQDPLD